MRILITTVACLFFFTSTFGQSPKKITTYLLTQYNKTVHDRTAGNNPWGIGLGVQAFYNNSTRFKPTIEITGDIYLEDDKVLRLDPDGSIPNSYNDVRGMINVFVGSSFQVTKGTYLSFLAGPGFISGQTLLGIKPSFGFYLSESKKWTGKISYINIFDRDKITKQDFGSISFAIGLRLF